MKKDMEKIRIVVSGVGNRALPKDPKNSNWSGWVDLMHHSGAFELVAAQDISPESLKRILERGYLKSSQLYTDLNTMLKEVPCEAIFIASVMEQHAPAIRTAVEKGLHVLVEKPFVADLSEGKKIISMAQEKNLALCVVQNWRTKDVGQILHDSIQKGLLGQIGHIFFRYLRDRENPRMPAYIFEERFPLLYANSIHHLDLFRYILQDDYESVAGFSMKPPWSIYKSDTGLNLFLKTKKGVTIVYSGSVSSRNKVLLQESFVIEGEKGTLFNESQWLEPPLWHIPYGKQEKIDLTAQVEKPSIFDQHNIADDRILANFSKVIRNGEHPVCSARDNIKSLAVLEATRVACETGQVVPVERFL